MLPRMFPPRYEFVAVLAGRTVKSICL